MQSRRLTLQLADSLRQNLRVASPDSEAELAAVALALGARRVPSVSRSETSLAAGATVSQEMVQGAAARIARGDDPLGEWFGELRSRDARRACGATYTPNALVACMLEWTASKTPARVVDAGTGSARFLVAAGRRFQTADLVGVELDPLAALMARGHLASAGLGARARVIRESYLDVELPPCGGPTLFVGNPPYVRHHAMSHAEKQWLARAGDALGIKLSGLSSSYVHFIAKTALIARPGDAGVFVTAAEWLKTNYGRALLELWNDRLGLVRLHVLDATALPFEGTLTTAAVACFEVGRTARTIWVRREADLARMRLSGGQRVPAGNVARVLDVGGGREHSSKDWVELGELCRVHRGQVTGSNAVWIADQSSRLPAELLFSSITRARELFAADGFLVSAHGFRRVVDLPNDLDELDAAVRRAVERFLSRARSTGAHRTYIATHRRPWWRVGLREPAPILATYMARRPPVFVRNLAGLRHLNIAHGLYPRIDLSPEALDALARHLTASTTLGEGRAYAGGLVKFEPREMERLKVPTPEALESAGSRQERRDVDARSLVVEARGELGRARVVRIERT
jgi:methylase of polypeptide subunit release factors